jgi:fructose-bisphosphate aldolase, class II
MPLVPLRTVLDHAAEHNYGVGAFNVNNMEQIQSIMEAAKETNSPVIVQASRGARSYSQDNYLRHLMLAAVELYPQIPIVMHQDHGNSPATCFSAIKYGFTSVMMDGSLMEDAATPGSFDYNVRVTKEVVAVAHAMGVSVEGEIGCLGQVGAAPVVHAKDTKHDADLEKEPGDKDGHATAAAHGGMDSSHLTDPDEAERFVAATKVDALAVAIGTSHGAYKFSKKPTGEVLKMTLIEEIHRRLPNTHLVMHGSSSVPESLLEVIRKYGGQMEETYGVPVEEIQRGIKNGVRKINVDTDCRLAITGAIRKVFAEKPKAFDPREYLKPARDAMKATVMARMIAFGQAGQASKFK